METTDSKGFFRIWIDPQIHCKQVVCHLFGSHGQSVDFLWYRMFNSSIICIILRNDRKIYIYFSCNTNLTHIFEIDLCYYDNKSFEISNLKESVARIVLFYSVWQLAINANIAKDHMSAGSRFEIWNWWINLSSLHQK